MPHSVTPTLPTRGSGNSGCRRVLALACTGTPTADYYIPAAAARALDGASITVVDASGPCIDQPPIEPGTWVIIFRHAHPSWLKLLVARRDKLVRVTWFMDDDIPGVIRENSLPRLYAWKTYARYLRIKGMLQTLGADYAFSTAELARRYPALRGEVWPPQQVKAESTRDRLLYFYHGTASHRAELAWLAPLVAEIQHRVPEAWFEVFADKKTRRLFRGIPRVRCIYPMNWPDFLTHTETIRADVGLAPLLDTSFNRCRAAVKIFDITRTGAAGVYSTGPVYQDVVVDGRNGLLLPNDQKLWASTVVRLLRSPEESRRLAAQAEQDCRGANQA
jgi:hypothetical protein